MKFVNRQEEMARLDRLIALKEGSFAVIWGRRRVGKTRLVLEWVDRHKGIYFMADESAPTIQRRYFSLAIEQVLPGFADVEYPDWGVLLSRLAKEAKQMGWRGPIVIDELPYLISGSPELPSVLQTFVDHEAKKAGLIIALCGSSQPMMMGAILERTAPLYGRAEEIIKLGPIAARGMEEGLGFKSPREVIENYAIWGGIPRYWELVANRGGPLIDTIDALVLDPLGVLQDEPNRLLHEELPSALILRPILDSIGLGARRLSEIAASLGQPATSLSRPLQRLKDLDFVEKEIPFGVLEHHSKRVLYKIGDPFIRFWFEVVAPRRSFFVQARASLRKKVLKDALPSLFSLGWEEQCRLAAPLLAGEWRDKIFLPARRFWHGQGPEWDCVTASEDGHELLLGEAKWSADPPTEESILRTIAELKRKGVPPIDRHHNIHVIYALFIPEKPKKLRLPEDTQVFDAADVLNA